MNTVKKTYLSKKLELDNYSLSAQRVALNTLLFDISKDMTKIYSTPENLQLPYQNTLEINEEKHSELKDMIKDIIAIEEVEGIEIDDWVAAFIEQAKEIKEPTHVQSLDQRHKMLCISVEKIRTDIFGIC